jgi:hypothetical protein
MKLGHLLTRSGLTYPEVSSKFYHDSFCQLDSSVSLPWVIYFYVFYLHVVSSFSCIPMICPKLVLFIIPLQFVHLFCNLSKCILLFFSCTSSLLLASLCTISSHDYAKIIRNSSNVPFLIILDKESEVCKFFFSTSATVYPLTHLLLGTELHKVVQVLFICHCVYLVSKFYRLPARSKQISLHSFVLLLSAVGRQDISSLM